MFAWGPCTELASSSDGTGAHLSQGYDWARDKLGINTGLTYCPRPPIQIKRGGSAESSVSLISNDNMTVGGCATTTAMEGRKQKKNHDELEVRNAGFIYPSKPSEQRLNLTNKQSSKHGLHVWEVV